MILCNDDRCGNVRTGQYGLVMLCYGYVCRSLVGFVAIYFIVVTVHVSVTAISSLPGTEERAFVF